MVNFGGKPVFNAFSKLDSRWKTALSFTLVAMLGASVVGCSQPTQVKQAKKGLGYSVTSAPVLSQSSSMLDFDYPSKPPSLKKGKEVFNNNCLQCHTGGSPFSSTKAQKDFLYATPIDMYLFLTTGRAPVLKEETEVRKQLVLSVNADAHRFRDKLTRDERWAAVFYARYLAGGSDISHAATDNNPDIAAVYGGNCAVCHGNLGHADGFLHTGHPSNHELAGAKIFGGVLYPPPARFTQYDRVFNRTDAQWFKYLVEGIYPSAMPAWLGNVDKDKNFVFDETLLWMLVKHLRSLALTNDLPGSAPAGLVPGSDLYPVLDQKIPPVSKLRPDFFKGKHQKEYPYKAPSKMPYFKKSLSEDGHES